MLLNRIESGCYLKYSKAVVQDGLIKYSKRIKIMTFCDLAFLLAWKTIKFINGKVR